MYNGNVLRKATHHLTFMTMTKKASLKRHLFHRRVVNVLNDNKLEYGNDLFPSGAF